MNSETNKQENFPLNGGSVKDLVCGMQVPANQNQLTYQASNFAFCSTQCRERFVANPLLYIGVPGHKAPVQEGVVKLKRRRLKLDRPLPDDLASKVISSIQQMMGIERIEIREDAIEIDYDLLQATEAQIEFRLAAIGATLNRRWSERLRRAFVDFVEENEVSNLEVSSGAGVHAHHH